ncbi:hypothetical protein TNCV_4373031 [Trichonephila clavipes]|uniref:Uncharacterized protein n=1 Tax=Trichonephila clavipes TaxID=2585209 RepID=A0A8X6UU71_TRICX|nr:hypothetical protein TNCV_4373031 [Trichonephila clavipes]
MKDYITNINVFSGIQTQDTTLTTSRWVASLDELAYRFFLGKQLRSVKRQFNLLSDWLWLTQYSAGLKPTFDLSTPA